MRVQSSRCMKPWGFFILTRFFHFISFFPLIIFCMLLGHVEVLEAFDQPPASPMKKRRQQGILTGMPFMANLAPRTFLDDTGRKLYLAKHPKRIISLAPSITEMLFALGLNAEIVGVTEFCDFPPEALNKPKVGYAQPNLETIVALQPDLILAPKSFLRADILGKLDQLKIPTFMLEATAVEDILSHIQLLGRMVGKTPEANKETARIRKRIADLSSRLEGLSRPTILYVINSEPFITVGPGSYIHHLIELAGGTNAAENANSPYPRLSMEEVLKQDPEYILFPVGKFEGIPQAEQDKWKRWTMISAVKQGQLFQIQADLLNRPGPRVIEGLEILVQVLHPEVMKAEPGSP